MHTRTTTPPVETFHGAFLDKPEHVHIDDDQQPAEHSGENVITHNVENNPVSVFDVTAYILEKQPAERPITTWKLQKLIFYCQAWSLVWEEHPLFDEKILAWANGPVVEELYEEHKGHFKITSSSKGSSENLSQEQKESIDQVLLYYGDKTAQWLSDLAHMEEPWIEARKGMNPGERGDREIDLSAIHEYYSSISPEHKITL